MRIQSDTVKAAVMRQVRSLLVIEDVSPPSIGPDEVLVETRTSGICGTDLHILEGHGYVPSLPHILGHEPAGVVAEVGADVTELEPGDRVVPHLFISCERCYYCRVGRHQQCGDLRGIIGVLCNGAFAEYFKGPAKNFFRLPESVRFDAGGLIADAVLTGVHASRRAGMAVGDSALVLGAGGVGQILIQILRSAGVVVAAADIHPEKLRLAAEFGARLAVDARDPASVRRIQEFSGTDGVQCAFNCVGDSASMRFCGDSVMRCGRIVVIGEEREDPRIDTTEIAHKELEIIGSRNGTRQDMTDAIRWVESGAVTPVIGARFPLSEINKAFDTMRQGVLGRVVVVVKES
jgi:D-arabinose 1-dehydrogenase-like Zn-dependent alcohol dehydrogenase